MSRVPPFWRGIALIALIAAIIVVLDQERSLATAATLLRFGFLIAIAVSAYFVWRDFGRREIELWPRRQQIVFYSAVGLLLADLGWYFARPLGGRDLLAFFLVAAACVYTGVRTWRDQHHYT